MSEEGNGGVLEPVRLTEPALRAPMRSQALTSDAPSQHAVVRTGPSACGIRRPVDGDLDRRSSAEARVCSAVVMAWASETAVAGFLPGGMSPSSLCERRLP